VLDPAGALGLHSAVVSEYEGLPAGRWTEPWPRQTVTLLMVTGALVVGFFVAAAVSAGRTVAQQQDVRRDELVALIQERQARTDQLTTDLADLRAEIDAAGAQAAAALPALRLRLASLEGVTGLTAVRGPGLRVTLADAEEACPTGRPDDCQVQDTDLQLAVNALFAAGAEAVAVNGERLIATSAVRSAGRSVLVNYRVLVSPYVVEAIGDPDRLDEQFRGTEVAHDFTVWSDVYGLGFAVEQVRRLELPAYSGGLRLRAAAAKEEVRP
jgi:uncharacterized protein YlxW (UPF0749 family)